MQYVAGIVYIGAKMGFLPSVVIIDCFCFRCLVIKSHVAYHGADGNGAFLLFLHCNYHPCVSIATRVHWTPRRISVYDWGQPRDSSG